MYVGPLGQLAIIQKTGPLEPRIVGRPGRRWFDPSSSPSAIELGSLPSNSVDRPQNPQQTETF